MAVPSRQGNIFHFSLARLKDGYFILDRDQSRSLSWKVEDNQKFNQLNNESVNSPVQLEHANQAKKYAKTHMTNR